MKNFKLNNKGMGRKETMIVLLLVLIFVAVIAYKGLGIGQDLSSDISKFKSLVSEFISEAGIIRDAEAIYTKRVFLYDVKDYNGSVYENPFEGDEYCDLYESSLQMDGNAGYVTFKCGDYLIYNERSNLSDFTVYKVSSWTDEVLTGDNVQEETFYNYSVDGITQLDDYYIEKQFLVEYNNKMNTNYVFIESIGNNVEILTKTYYRTMEKVE